MSQTNVSFPQPTVPAQGQTWFIRCVKAMDLYSNDDGLCEAISFAAIPMIFQTADEKTEITSYRHV